MNKLALSFLALNLVSPNDEYFHQQWYLKNSGFNIKRDITEISSISILGKTGADIHFPFDLTLPNGPRKPVVVAVLDTGVDIDHIDLKDSILRSSECDSVGNIPPKNSPDKDGNGFKGDCAGWNFASSTNAEGDNQVYDDTGHGTHLSGLIAAKINEKGIRGISDQIKILPVKIFNKYEIPNHPLRPKMKMMERIQKGLEYAIQKNVDVINLSLGWPSILDSPKIRELFELAAAKNILVVAAAGNNAQHTTIFPCSYASVLCVGATSVDGTVAPFSNYGGNVDIMAPGENILSTIPKKITPLYFDEDGFDYKNGTSQAAPLVAGSAALLKLVLGSVSADELKARLLSAAQKNNSQISSFYGDLNLSNALKNKPNQFIYPNLKELNTVEVSHPTARFTFDIKLTKLIKNSATAGKLSLHFEGIPLNQNEYAFEFSSEDHEKVIHVSGNVPELMLSSTQTLTLNLTYGEQQHSFKKELTFALNANEVGSKIFFDEKINTEKLKSVDDSMKLSDQTLFFTQESNSENQVLTFYAIKSSKLKKLFSFVKKADLKLVATVLTQSKTLCVEFYDATNKKLIYDFWDIHLGTQSKSLEMVPDSAVFTLHQATYWNQQSGLKAVSLANGKIPPAEANKSVWLNSQNGASDHLYYFSEVDGKITTALLDNEELRNTLIKKYRLRFDDALMPIAILNKGINSTIDTLFAIGKGYERKVLLIRFHDRNHFEIKREYLVPGGAALREITFLGKSMLLTQERKDAYQMFDLDAGHFTTFEWNDESDLLLSPIAKITGNRLLAQTQNHFVVLGEGSNSKLPLKRFSFLPGELFSEMFTPVEVQSAEGLLPALFIDGTMISDQHLGVVLWDGEKIVKPIHFQLKLPKNCRVMNPQRIEGVHSMILLCESETEGQYLLKRSLLK